MTVCALRIQPFSSRPSTSSTPRVRSDCFILLIEGYTVQSLWSQNYARDNYYIVPRTGRCMSRLRRMVFRQTKRVPMPNGTSVFGKLSARLMFSTPSFCCADSFEKYSNCCGDINRGKSAQTGVMYTVLCGKAVDGSHAAMPPATCRRAGDCCGISGVMHFGYIAGEGPLFLLFFSMVYLLVVRAKYPRGSPWYMTAYGSMCPGM